MILFMIVLVFVFMMVVVFMMLLVFVFMMVVFLFAATHETELGDPDFCLSRSHYTDTDPTCRERAATTGIEPGTSSPRVARSTAELPRPYDGGSSYDVVGVVFMVVVVLMMMLVVVDFFCISYIYKSSVYLKQYYNMTFDQKK